MKINKYWFKPKKYGYGAYPVTLEGYLVTLALMGVFALSIHYYILLKTHIFLFFGIFSLILLIYISKKKTKEKWKWRFG
jgi:hypothetical protein